ncbi:hypothetical protein [Caldifermentibacillus hisashii]
MIITRNNGDASKLTKRFRELLT